MTLKFFKGQRAPLSILELVRRGATISDLQIMCGARRKRKPWRDRLHKRVTNV